MIQDIEGTKKKIEAALERVRPALRADGGDARILEVTPEGHVRLELLGTCGGCPMSAQTLHQGIERVIKAEVPEVIDIIAVESHAH